MLVGKLYLRKSVYNDEVYLCYLKAEKDIQLRGLAICQEFETRVWRGRLGRLDPKLMTLQLVTKRILTGFRKLWVGNFNEWLDEVINIEEILPSEKARLKSLK